MQKLHLNLGKAPAWAEGGTRTVKEFPKELEHGNQRTKVFAIIYEKAHTIKNTEKILKFFMTLRAKSSAFEFVRRCSCVNRCRHELCCKYYENN